ncbi:glycosyl transferase family 2 [Solidesulfovibrio carbinoliphilus subsp. oakridgensis]|uniref:Glycosyl transferase family 2 n=1 Tax=Solidesulfovibrio carbinoliphilus subsp. oakridgensis TaxID=694327 RepID=G7QDL4_9BACT|nr:glycosyltransferase [Solidesulfovibrio carbinoliphilus]EHJ46520.1 glycosyl transferase family 2 [Solidesulfovibrio carbinoliphilus subsp. oakridgensis]
MAFDLRRLTPPPLPSPGPGFLAEILRALPLWALTSEQKELRLSLCGLLIGQGNPACLAAAQALLALAFQEDPFDAASTALLESVEASHPFLPPRAVAVLRLVRTAPAPAASPEADVSFEAIRASGDIELVVRYLEIAARDRHHALARLAPAFAALCRLPDADTAARLLAAFAPHLPPPLFARLSAELACLRLPPADALDRIRALDGEAWGLFAAIAASHCLERLGDRDGALAACLAARTSLPHHVNLTLRACELSRPLPIPPAPGPNEAAVCLYSMNKAELFRECLAHLAATDLGHSLVAVLDNGSTDHTAEVVAQAAGRFPEGRFLSVRLPVNVGAPGARNWLLSLPEVKAHRHVAFLDDDAFPEHDWLARLLETARNHPTAGTVGCAIVDKGAPRDHQSADFNLFPPELGTPSLPETKERLFICEPCRGAPDFGLYAYTRACLSVSGCCHLLPHRTIETVGGFDIRYNPTQFDDLDRDIRSFLAGAPCVYDGTVRVGHKQGSSLALAETPAQVAHIVGNKIKLEYGVSDADADRLWRENLELLGRELLEKDKALAEVAREKMPPAAGRG